MIYESLAALTRLAPVRSVGGVVGVRYQLLRSLRPISRNLLDEGRDGYTRRRYRLRTLLCANRFHDEIIPVRVRSSGFREERQAGACAWDAERSPRLVLQKDLYPRAPTLLLLDEGARVRDRPILGDGVPITFGIPVHITDQLPGKVLVRRIVISLVGRLEGCLQ